MLAHYFIKSSDKYFFDSRLKKIRQPKVFKHRNTRTRILNLNIAQFVLHEEIKWQENQKIGKISRITATIQLVWNFNKLAGKKSEKSTICSRRGYFVF